MLIRLFKLEGVHYKKSDVISGVLEESVCMRILVTGAAGFIGMHVAMKLLEQGHEVAGLDSLNDYYDVNLKKARLKQLLLKTKFEFHHLNLQNKIELDKLLHTYKPEAVINLAAQAGVRYSIEHPASYVESNLVGFANLIEGVRHLPVNHFVYASSSSVYGLNEALPFDEGQGVDHPLALYGATKKANEALAHSYSHLFKLPTTGLRFFTVYGPWGRPDMALFKFTKAIISGDPIEVYNNGQMMRDFTYIDDVSDAVIKVLFKPATENALFRKDNPDRATSAAPWRIFNVGRGQTVSLTEFIFALETIIGKKAQLKLLDMQPGDVQNTFSDTKRLQDWIDWTPAISITEGVQNFVDWYKKHYQN